MSRLSLRTSDGLHLVGRVFPALEPRAAVVLVHGFTAHKEHPEVVAVAEALAERGFDVVAYDARGHGESDGICTLGNREREDVAAAVAEARRRCDKVVVVGASMGGIAALRYAAEDPYLTGLVTVSSPANWRLPRTIRGVLLAVMTRTRAGRAVVARHMQVRLSKRWEGGDPPAKMASRLRIPYAVIHGRDDGYVEHSEAEALYLSTPEPRRIDVVAGMGHAFDAAAVPAICAAVEWCLDTPGPGSLVQGRAVGVEQQPVQVDAAT